MYRIDKPLQLKSSQRCYVGSLYTLRAVMYSNIWRTVDLANCTTR